MLMEIKYTKKSYCLTGKTFRIHACNTYRQYSELKKNLKQNETILSIDFARNNKKQLHKSQSA